jgi:hypothetical protein
VAPAVLTAFCVGCGDARDTQREADRFLGRFALVDSIEIETEDDRGIARHVLPESAWKSLNALLLPAIEDPQPLKYEVIGRMRVASGSSKHEWLFLAIGESEAGLRISINEYWRGIDRRKLDEFLKGNAFGQRKQ